MAAKIKDKLSNLFIIIALVVNLLIVILTFLFIREHLIQNKISKYSSQIEPIAENARINLQKAIVIGQTISTNLSTFYSNSSPITLSDEYLNIISRDILTQNYYVQAIGYAISGEDFSYRLTGDNFVDQDGMFRGLWYKSLNQQVKIKYLKDKNLDVDLLMLEAKKQKQPVFGEPFFFNTGDKVVYVIPIAFPIYLGDAFKGATFMLISVDFLNEILDYSATTQSERIFVVDNNGVLLSFPLEPSLVGKNITSILPDYSIELLKKIRNQESINQSFGDNFVICKYAPINADTYWVVGIVIPNSIFFRDIRKIVALLILFALISTLALLLLYRMLTARLSYTANMVISDVENIYKGKLLQPIRKLTFFEEVEKITDLLEKLRLRLLHLTEVHKNIGNRIYDKKIQAFGDNDVLARSINEAMQQIMERWQKRNLIEISKQRADWINTGVAKIYEATRVEENSLELLARNVLATLIDYTSAFLGGLFVYREDKNNLKAAATFAYDSPKVFQKEIELGEGLVGAVALERKTKYITKVPDDYDIIVVGLGETKPESIIIQPLIFENELLGVLELAFLKKLEDYELEFIDKAALTISQAIKTLKINIRTKELLEQSQQQAQELEKARKLLQQHVAELEKRERQLQENQARMKGILDAVNHTLMTIEYTTDGILITANEKYLKTMHYTLDELVGVNVLDLVRSEREELAQVIKRVSQGEYFEKIMKRFTKYGEVRWLYSTYTPYYDVNGKITKILYFAFDVTDTYNKIQELEKEVEALRKQLKLMEEALKS